MLLYVSVYAPLFYSEIFMDSTLYEENRLKMAHRAKSFGFAALMCSVILFSIPYIAIGLGFLALLFGALSKGYKPKVDRDAKFGMTFAAIAIAIGIGVISSSFYKLATDAEYRGLVSEALDGIYGETYEEMYGENPSDILDEWFGGDSTNVDL